MRMDRNIMKHANTTVFHRLEATACIWRIRLLTFFFRKFHTILMKKRKKSQIQAAAYERWKIVAQNQNFLKKLALTE